MITTASAGKKHRWLIVGLLVVGSILAVVLLFPFIEPLTIFSMVHSRLDSLPWSPQIKYAVAILLTPVVILAIRLYFRGKVEGKLLGALILGCLLLGVYFLAQPKPGELYTSDGVANYRWDRDTSGKINLLPKWWKVNTRTGRTLQELTPEIAEEWNHQQSEAIAATKHSAAGKITFLPPLSPAKDQHQPVVLKHVDSPANEQEKNLANFKASINPSVVLISGKRNIVVFITSSGPAVDFVPEQVLYGALASTTTNFITDAVKPAPLTRLYFEKLYGGDQELVKVVAASTRVDGLIVGSLTYAFRTSASISHDCVCETALSYKVLGATGNIMRADAIRIVHPSYSEGAALQQAVRLIGGKLSQEILNIF